MRTQKTVDSEDMEELARYRDAINQVGDGFFILDVERRFAEVNAELCGMFARTPADFIGHTPFEFITEAGWPLLREMIEISNTGRRQSRYEAVRTDGSTFPILVRAVTHC